MRRRNSSAVRTWIQTFFVAGIAALTIPLVGAAPATQASQTVVVYPLVASQGAPPTIGLTVARFLVTGISRRAGVTAKLAPGDTAQADYLQTARTLGADYYVAGFVSAIGDEVSAVEQLVATKNGVVVWQNTAAYTVPDDARASGVAMHDAIVALTTPQYAPLPAGGAAAAPDTAPAPTVPTVSRRSAPTAPASPLPIPVEAYAPPADPTLDGPRVVVLNFGGHALDAVRHYVPSSIIRTLPRYHMSGSVLDLGVSDVAADGLVACAQAGADYLIGGNIESGEEGDPGLGFSIASDLTLDIYNCKHMNAKPLVIEKSTANGDSQTSVDIAVDQALKAFAGTKPAAR
jgi:TolB-like protein